MTARNKTVLSTAALMVALSLGVASPAMADKLGKEARTGLDLTLYQSGMAVVSDKRLVPVTQGESDIVFDDVSKQLNPSTAILSPIDDGKTLKTLSMTHLTGKLNQKALLKANLGKEITIIGRGPNPTTRKAKLIGLGKRPIFEIDGKIHTNVKGEFVFEQLPPGATTDNGLIFKLKADKAEPVEMTLTYQTDGISWQANYVAIVNSADNGLNLTGRAKIHNNTGMDIEKANTALIAGTVNRATPPQPVRMMEKGMAAAAPAMDAAEQIPRQEFSDYHLYQLQAPLTLADNASIQVSLLDAPNAKVAKEYILQGHGGFYHGMHRGDAQPTPAAIRYSFTNTDKNGLGLPLPAGTISLYKQTNDQGLKLIGESHLGNTPAEQDVRLNIGRAFDVTSKHIQTDFKKISNRVNESGHRIEITNSSSKGVTVRLIETLPGDWEILRESQKHTKTAANRAEWTIPVPAKGKVQLKYQVRTKF